VSGGLSRAERIGLRLHRSADRRLGRFGAWVYRRTNGGITRPWHVDALLLTTRGRRSGKARTVVLQFLPDGDSMVVAAANDGGESHPGWYHNLTADPNAVVEVMGRTVRVRADELPAEAAAAFWQRILVRAPTYERYSRATARTFPIVRLVPEAGAHDAIEATMRAIVRDRYGSPDVLELREIGRPAVGDDDVRVRVRAASLNAADLDYLHGRPLLTRFGTGFRRPRNRGLGLDAAGEVEAVGRKVTALQAGDAVFGDLTAFGYGAFAEFASAPARAWARIPAGMTFEVAACLPQAAILALQGLRGGRPIQPGDRVLVNGASGNVGPFAVQIAKAFGAEVTAVCSTGKQEFVRDLGADHVIDYTTTDYTRSGRRYDRILDVAGNRSIFECVHALRPGGAYVMVGGPTRRILEALLLGPLLSLAARRRMSLMVWWRPFAKDDVATLVAMVGTGTVAPVADRRYPLAQVADALRYLEEGRARGKVVITI
jgi:deazaflavin-dependent oxidoreductase (nitroreductase family)